MGTSFLKSRFSKKAVFCTCYEEEKTKALLFWFALLWFGLDVWLLMYLVGWIPGCWVVWFFSVLVVLCLFVCLSVCLSVCLFFGCLSVCVCQFVFGFQWAFTWDWATKVGPNPVPFSTLENSVAKRDLNSSLGLCQFWLTHLLHTWHTGHAISGFGREGILWCSRALGCWACLLGTP